MSQLPVMSPLSVEKPTANALLDRLLGAEVRFVPTREARAHEVEAAATDARRKGLKPYVIPIGASNLNQDFRLCVTPE